MFDSEMVRSHLEELDKYYNDSQSSPELVAMVAKLAVLELSGWVEECLHKIARSSVTVEGTDERALELVNETIRKCHGVNYERHVQQMFSVAFGASQLANIESKLKESAKFEQFKAELGNVQVSRNNLAHTYTRGTPMVDAPRTTLQRFDRLNSMLYESKRIGLNTL